MTSPIARTFAHAKAEDRLAFMPFVAAGDPDLAATVEIVRTLADAGVDLIEVGVPYSDPIADGPVIQASYTRALSGGFTLGEFFRTFAGLDTAGLPPLVAMVSVSIVQRIGPATFSERAKSAGFAGLIVPDLPGDESATIAAAVREAGLDLIQLVSPLTPPARVETVLRHCTGFVYCLSVAGITGERDALPEELAAHLGRLRGKTDLPLAVGFGISRPEHVRALHGRADGAIVGSALVRRTEGFAEDREGTLNNVRGYADSMLAACRPNPSGSG